MGSSDFGSNCVIRNKDVIRFRDSKSLHRLDAIALEPLEIENRALGYHITYQLESFSYDFNTHFLIFTGYPFFQELPAGSSRKKRWEKAREETYYGSLMHFMRALFRNKIMEEGFDVHQLKKIPNIEKARVKEKMKTLDTSGE